MAQDFKNGIAPDVLAERTPHAGRPKREKEALRIYENLDAVLRAAGTDRTQSRPHRPVLHHGESRAALPAGPPRIPVRPHSAVDLDRAAGPAAARRRHEHPGARRHPAARASRSPIIKHEALAGRPTSGYSPAAHRRRLHLHSRHHLARDRRRAAAQRRCRGGADDRGHAMGRPCRSSSRPSSSSRERMVQSLALAGAKLDDVVHAQVYLTDREDYSAFNEAWTQALCEVAADARHHPLHPARACALRRQDRDQRHGAEARQRGARSAPSMPASSPRSPTSRRRSRPAICCSCRG